MAAEHRRPETRPSDTDEATAAFDAPGVEPKQPVTALALVGIEADYVPDEFMT